MTETLDTRAAPAAHAAHRPAGGTPPPGRRWLGLFVVLAAMVLNLLDATVTNIALPSIRADLGGSYASLQWVAAGYTLALAVGLITGGRLGDLLGRKRMLLTGVAGFVLASLACAAAVSPVMLIAARVAQGLFGALMIPQGFGLIRDLFPPRETRQAFATFGPVIGLATILGPVVAGLLIDADVAGTGWRMIFLINLPLGAFSLVVGARVLPGAGPAGGPARLDLTGALLAGSGMCLLVYPLVQGRELGWPAWSLLMAAASVPVLAAFALHQVRRKRAGGAPLVEPSVFTKRSYTSGIVFVVAFFGAVAGFSLTTGLFLQLGLGHTPLRASLVLSAWAAGAFVGSGVGSTLTTRLGRAMLHVGLVLMAAGIAGLYLVLQRSGAGVGGWDLVAPLAGYGLGMGMIFAPLFDIIMGGVDDDEVGSAGGVLESVQQLGVALGVAVLGTVFFGAVGAQAPHHFDTTVPALRAQLAAAGVPAAAQPQLIAEIRACVHDRERATDPDAAPATCQPSGGPASPAVAAAVSAAGWATHQRASADAAGQVALLALALTVVTFLLGFLLPACGRAPAAPVRNGGTSCSWSPPQPRPWAGPSSSSSSPPADPSARSPATPPARGFPTAPKSSPGT